MPFKRISVDHRAMVSVPCIRGTRIPVDTVVRMVSEGMSVDEVLSDFPKLGADSVLEARRFAVAMVDERTLPLRLSA